jgi:hypothetical protein
MKFFKVMVASFVLAIGTVGSVPVAQAAPGDSISLYFSAPFVTGSAVTDGVGTENFNSYSTGACPTTITGFATLTFSPSGCEIESQAGTSPGDSEPAVGVALSPYVSKTLSTTFTFDNPVKYVGFWWMMGSNGNNVEFLDSTDSVIANFNVNDVITFLGPNSSVSNSDSRTVTNVGGGTYPTRHYYRSPANYTGTVASPNMNYNTMTYANEPWIYLNLYVSGTISVSKVRFTGAAFEFDNLTVTGSDVEPTSDLVLVKNVYEAPLEDQTVTWTPTNTNFSDPDTELTPSAPATSSGSGAITYEVVDAGTTGCTVDSATGVITRTSIGDCVVRATAAAVPGSYNSAYTDVTFTFTTEPGSTTPESETGSNNLAETGFDPLIPLGLALTSLIVGAGALVITRRKTAKL